MLFPGTNLFGPLGHKMGRWLAACSGLIIIGICLILVRQPLHLLCVHIALVVSSADQDFLLVFLLFNYKFMNVCFLGYFWLQVTRVFFTVFSLFIH